jgi:hypothetical protein
MMNTGVGVINLAGSKQFICLIIIVGLSMACGTDERELKDIPIVVSQPEAETVDINLAITNAHKEVEKILPSANLTFFSLVAECEALSELRGEINLFFSKTQQTFWGERVFTARVVVDTVQQKMQMKVRDETEQYLSTEPLELDRISTLEIATALEAYLKSIDQCQDTVVLGRTDTNGPWRVRCGPPDDVFIECIEIDPATGNITQLR